MGLELNQLDLVMRDAEATLAFYRALGVDIPEEAIWRTATGIHHVDLQMESGFALHFDSAALTRAYDQGWKEPSGTGTRTVATFGVSSREEVDRVHGKLTALGYASSQPPFDAFWGARYAIIEDPNGIHVGVMSPSDPSRRVPPPDL